MPTYKFGVEVPHSVKQAMAIDKKNSNHFWRDAGQTEINQLDEYEVFEDLGPGAAPPEATKRSMSK